MSFNKDALIHKLQEENDELHKERNRYSLTLAQAKFLREEERRESIDAVVKDALYQFVQFYKEDEFDQLDMMLIVDRFLEDEYDKGKR